MKIATWNVNSIRVRQQRLLDWVQQVQPDVLCLQELKTTDESFPYDAVREAGYHAAVFGQKTYNGVAILSRTPPSKIERGWGDGAGFRWGPETSRHPMARKGARVAQIAKQGLMAELQDGRQKRLDLYRRHSRAGRDRVGPWDTLEP